MAKAPNYRFEKRQKELSRKAKQDRKQQRRVESDAAETGDGTAADDVAAGEETENK